MGVSAQPKKPNVGAKRNAINNKDKTSENEARFERFAFRFSAAFDGRKRRRKEEKTA